MSRSLAIVDLLAGDSTSAIRDRSHSDQSHGALRGTMGLWIQQEAGMPERTPSRPASVGQG